MSARTIMLLVSIALLVAISTCNSEEPKESIDPCPGWPAFKVGNRWIYKFESIKMPIYYFVTDTIIADTVVYLNGKAYLRMKYTSKEIQPYFIRCHDDSIFMTTIGENEYLRWDFNAKKGDKWLIKNGLLKSDYDDSCLNSIECVDENYHHQYYYQFEPSAKHYGDSIDCVGRSYKICWNKENEPETEFNCLGEVVCHEYGIVEYFNYYLFEFRTAEQLAQ